MLVLLEGNIAAGKTTFGEKLVAGGTVDFVPEPVARWQSGFAANLLDRFYTDTARWAFTLQICAFVTRVQALDARPDPQRVTLFERSVYCDRHVFAKNLHEHGLMDDTEWALYCNFWDFMADTIPKPDAIIYLRTPADVCFQRLHERGRAEERGITLAYLQQLEEHHDAWLLTPGVAEKPVLVLDGTGQWNAADIHQQLVQVVPQVRER